MRLQDLTKDHLEILDNWYRKEVIDQERLMNEVLNIWDKFHRLSREEKDKLWDTCS